MTSLAEPSAIATHLEHQRRQQTAELIRRLFILAHNGTITEAQAADVAAAAGIGMTRQQVEDGGRWLDTLADPRATAARLAHDKGLRDGAWFDLEGAVAESAQNDLDDLIAGLVDNAINRHVICVVALNVVNALVGDES